MNLLVKFILFCMVLFITQPCLCCINEYRTLLNGEIELKDAQGSTPFARFDIENKDYLGRMLYEADSIYKATGNIEDYSDYGAMLIYNGQYLEAKTVFFEIERKVPGLYATAANLATNYELLGQNDSALIWMKKALQINPHSHDGSEWIHLKIIEAKIQSKGNAGYFGTHNILSLNFGESLIPENKDNMDLNQLRKQLYHQLTERMTFVKPPNEIVGQLLFELGNVTAMTMDVKSGVQVYEIAKQYGFQSALLTQREQHFKALQQKADFRNKTEGWAKENRSTSLFLLCLLTAGVIGCVVYFVRRKRFKKQRSGTP